MPVAEPALAALPNPAARYLMATRPAFLVVTLAGCAVGLATAWIDGVAIDPLKAFATLAFALAAHAAANVLNDYYDSRNGTDAANQERLFPYTGGSRFIQNGVIGERQMLAWGAGLAGATVAGGLWLMAVSAPGLFFFGVAGLAIAWGYSAPPLALNSRGWGEACIWFSWMLVAAGTDYVQRAHASPAPWIASAGYALMVTNVLFINQFPDRRADAAAGKRHWVVRLGPDRAAPLYAAIGFTAYACVVAGAAFGALPALALLALAAAPLTIKASVELSRHRNQPARLEPAIRATIAAAVAHGALLTLGLVLSRFF